MKTGKNKKNIGIVIVVFLVLALAFLSGEKLSPGEKSDKKTEPESSATEMTKGEAFENIAESEANPQMAETVLQAETEQTTAAESGQRTTAGQTTVKQTGASEKQTTTGVRTTTAPQTAAAPPATTAPVPTTTAQPETDATLQIGSCQISISCSTILNHMDSLTPEKKGIVPADGWILKPVTVPLYEGDSVFDILNRICRERKIHMEFLITPIYNSAYIEGIANLYEYDCGDDSGWIYKVNGVKPNVGCSAVAPSDGDVIEWVYTCEYGDVIE